MVVLMKELDLKVNIMEFLNDLHYQIDTPHLNLREILF